MRCDILLSFIGFYVGSTWEVLIPRRQSRNFRGDYPVRKLFLGLWGVQEEGDRDCALWHVLSHPLLTTPPPPTNVEAGSSLHIHIHKHGNIISLIPIFPFPMMHFDVMMHFDFQLQNGCWGTCRASAWGRSHRGWSDIKNVCCGRLLNLRLMYLCIDQVVEEEVLPPACMDLTGFPLKTDIFEGSWIWHLNTRSFPL